MDFLILTRHGADTECRVNLRHIVQMLHLDPKNETTGTAIFLIDDKKIAVSESISKIEVAIRKLGGKLIAA